jgi:chalcone synthase
VWTSQEIVPGTWDGIVTTLREEGLVLTLHRDVPLYVSGAVGRSVARALREAPTLAPDLNEEVFWVMHVGVREILDRVQRELGLGEGNLAPGGVQECHDAVRQHVDRSSCVILIMEEMRRMSEEMRLRYVGKGLDWASPRIWPRDHHRDHSPQSAAKP